jgi:hypothetical protein
MTKSAPHPLVPWLEKEGFSLYGFAQAKNVPWRALYRHIDSDKLVRHPDAIVMDRIATATDGAVTVQDQVDWFKKMGRRRERA